MLCMLRHFIYAILHLSCSAIKYRLSSNVSYQLRVSGCKKQTKRYETLLQFIILNCLQCDDTKTMLQMCKNGMRLNSYQI